MELFTSVWIVFILYCTEWLGIHHCYALPVPTLTNNFHHGYYSKNSWDYKHTRNPGIQYEKFVFPSKQQEIAPIDLAERSSLGGRNSEKIFFPDEIPEQPKEKEYEYTDSELLPVWKTQLRPAAAVSSIPKEWPSLEQTKTPQSSEDGSIRMESPKSQMQLLPDISQASNPDSNLKNTLNFQSQSGDTKKRTQEERVQEAVQEFYKWLILSRGRPKHQQKGTKKCPDQPETGSSVMAGSSATSVDNNNSNNSASSFKPDTVISDQSLVAGLKDQKCPEGQIRLQNGECKVKLAI